MTFTCKLYINPIIKQKPFVSQKVKKADFSLCTSSKSPYVCVEYTVYNHATN